MNSINFEIFEKDDMYSCFKIFKNFSINDKLIIYSNDRRVKNFAVVTKFTSVNGKLCLLVEVVAPHSDVMAFNPYDSEYEVVNLSRLQE